MVGKWHVGLRYSRKDGKPAAEWRDADLSKPLAVSPVDHGFDFAVTPRAHMGLLVPRLIASERISAEIAIHLISP